MNLTDADKSALKSFAVTALMGGLLWYFVKNNAVKAAGLGAVGVAGIGAVRTLVKV